MASAAVAFGGIPAGLIGGKILLGVIGATAGWVAVLILDAIKGIVKYVIRRPSNDYYYTEPYYTTYLTTPYTFY